MYHISFSNQCEIRMGSPFNVADLKISGDFVSDLSGHSFQDLSLWNYDNNTKSEVTHLEEVHGVL